MTHYLSHRLVRALSAFVCLIPLFSLLTACTVTYDPTGLGGDYEPTYLSLPGDPLVEIIDARADTTSRSLSVPFMSFPGFSDNFVEPAVSWGHYKFIQAEFSKHFEGGDPVLIVVTVLVGVQRFIALTMSERCEAEVMLSVAIYRNGRLLGGREYLGEAVVGAESFDMSRGRAEDIYLMAIVASIEMSLKSYVVEIHA